MEKRKPIKTRTINTEEQVYKIIFEHLNQNKPFRIMEMIPLISSRFAKLNLEINENGIKKVLTSLIKKKLIVEGSVFTKGEILKNQKRETIFRIIRNNPGIITSKIIKKSRFNNFIVFWHLNILLKFNFIKKNMIENHQIFYDSSTTIEEATYLYYFRNKKCRQIIEYLRKNDIGVTKTQISSDLQFHFYTTAKYLTALEEIKIIRKEKISNILLYFLIKKKDQY
ncbi:MAG: hypothetical protein ACFFAS_09365 [Promethearchaeota archaeon]